MASAQGAARAKDAPGTARAQDARGAVGAAGATGGWKAADPAYTISLPRDHSAHPDARIEWWYYTGNLATRDGRRFGYQLTFFRAGVDAQPVNPSRWAVRDLYMAHFAISDVKRGRHVHADRLNRAGPGWAGASTSGYRVWNEDWDLTTNERGEHRLRARDARIALDLTLSPGKPVVLHGERGYSRKGPTSGNASHYYSFTRMPSAGSISLDGERFDVTGSSWMDHEWGTSFLEAGQVGWDWFSIQLDDEREVMLFQIRRSDGVADPFASGTVVDASGRVSHLGAGDFTLMPRSTWTSPASGARYPVTWSVSVPSIGLEAEVGAAFPEQEMRTEASTSVSYWEGAVDVEGTTGEVGDAGAVGAGGAIGTVSARGTAGVAPTVGGRGAAVRRPVRGRGYLEMTGYTGRPMSEVLR